MELKAESPVYRERLTSPRTLAFFLGLVLIFGLLFAWRLSMAGFDALGIILLCLAVIFLFYVINYRSLVIMITPQSLMLKFGIFKWTEQLDNIATSQIDELPWLLKYGGAGIHFMTVNQRYRASFNFLEYPRVVIALKHKRGLVHDLSFSTQNPEQVIQILHGEPTG